MHQPRGARGGERSRRQYFYIHQDYCIQEAWRRFQYDLQREDFRRLDNAGNQRYIDGVAQAYDTYAANWSLLCAELPGLAIVVPVAKGGNKGQGKGKGKQQPAEAKQGGKGQGQQGTPGVANPKAKPQATPKAEQPTATKAPQPKARDTPGTPAVAKATPLGGGGSGSGASSSGGLPVAAPKAEGAAPPAEPKSAAPEPAPAASEEKAPEPTADEPAPLTAAEVLPKEEPELGEVKEEPGEEAKEEEVVKEEAPDDDIDAGAAEAPVVDSVADAAPDDIDTGAAEAPDVDCVEAGDDDGAGPEEPEDVELEAAEDPEGGTAEYTEAVPIDVDQEEAVHSSPAPEAAVDLVQSPASPDFSERAFSEPPERPQPEGRLRTRPRILRPPSDLPPGTYPTVRLDRQGLWILVSPNPGHKRG